MTLHFPPPQIVTAIKPQDNSLLEGLYKSGGMFCTQVGGEVAVAHTITAGAFACSSSGRVGVEPLT